MTTKNCIAAKIEGVEANTSLSPLLFHFLCASNGNKTRVASHLTAFITSPPIYTQVNLFHLGDWCLKLELEFGIFKIILYKLTLWYYLLT